MDENLYRQVSKVVRDIKKQLGENDPVALYIASAVVAKKSKDRMKKFIDGKSDPVKKITEDSSK